MINSNKFWKWMSETKKALSDDVHEPINQLYDSFRNPVYFTKQMLIGYMIEYIGNGLLQLKKFSFFSKWQGEYRNKEGILDKTKCMDTVFEVLEFIIEKTENEG